MDSQTIAKVIQGDAQAFEAVYLQTHDKAYSIAYRVLKDDYEAEDIVQDAYIKMIEQISQLENPEKLESWFYRIVQNKALDFLRTSHNDTFSSFESEDTDFSFSDSLVSDYTPFDPEASADYAELKRIMDGFVAELPEMQRKCILLRFQQDKKISEIARILGIPESTVKSNLNYGKKKIEGEVRALEKQGVKLYSLSPLTVIAFLRWMWGKSAASAFAAGIGSAGAATAAATTATAATTTTVATTTTATTAASASTATAAASAAASVSSAVSSAAVGAAVKTGIAVGTKHLLAGILAVAVVGGGTAAAVHSEWQPASIQEATNITTVASKQSTAEDSISLVDVSAVSAETTEDAESPLEQIPDETDPEQIPEETLTATTLNSSTDTDSTITNSIKSNSSGSSGQRVMTQELIDIQDAINNPNSNVHIVTTPQTVVGHLKDSEPQVFTYIASEAPSTPSGQLTVNPAQNSNSTQYWTYNGSEAPTTSASDTSSAVGEASTTVHTQSNTTTVSSEPPTITVSISTPSGQSGQTQSPPAPAPAETVRDAIADSWCD